MFSGWLFVFQHIGHLIQAMVQADCRVFPVIILINISLVVYYIINIFVSVSSMLRNKYSLIKVSMFILLT